MRSLLAVLLCLAGSAAAQTGFERPLAEAASGARAAARELRRRPREVVCTIDADRPIAAVNQMGRLAPDQRFPVEIAQLDATRIEVRAQALPLGFRPSDDEPGFVKAAGVMIGERGTDADYWLVGLMFQEFHGGSRLLHVWQIVSKIGEEPREFDADLSKAPAEEFSAVIAAKSGPVKVRVTCAVAEPPVSPAAR